MHAYRTHNCAELRPQNVGQMARLSGWVHRKRDHGGVLFVDLRDHYGLTQIVVNPDSGAFATIDAARAESVLTVTGEVVARSDAAVNPKMATGAIELRAAEVTVQSAASELPLPVAGEAEYPEDIRLKYRFLDLRRERLHRNIMLRSNVIASLRRRMIAQGFTEFQTPILTASSPEGARDFLVPSRVHPGKFYALPQAPQMFKQLLMVAGFDRYFQIAPCFRDEDARADRSPGEFYQLDFEMSFVTQDDVFAAIEPVLAGVFEEFGNKTVTPAPFPRIPYAESMLKYGNDKPRPAQPDRDRRRHRAIPGQRLWHLRADDRGRRGGARGADARHCVAATQLFRRAQRLGQGRRLGRPRLHDDEGGRGGRTDRQEPRARTASRRWWPRLASAPTTGWCLPLTNRRRRRSLGGPRAHQGSRGARVDRGRRVQILLDRRLPDVRI